MAKVVSRYRKCYNLT
jgi:5'-AMP-activated protein kinase catalytic alpha subunit